MKTIKLKCALILIICCIYLGAFRAEGATKLHQKKLEADSSQNVQSDTTIKVQPDSTVKVQPDSTIKPKRNVELDASQKPQYYNRKHPDFTMYYFKSHLFTADDNHQYLVYTDGATYATMVHAFGCELCAKERKEK